jgi:hypothetical protein
MLHLYKISQHVNNTWDTYDSAVVVAATPEEARLIHPKQIRKRSVWTADLSTWWELDEDGYPKDDSWAHPDKVEVELVGEAAPHLTAGTVVCASFKAG